MLDFTLSGNTIKTLSKLDPLVFEDDSNRLYDKAKASGVDVHLDIWNEMWHVFQGWVGDVPEAEQSLKKIKEWKENIAI